MGFGYVPLGPVWLIPMAMGFASALIIFLALFALTAIERKLGGPRVWLHALVNFSIFILVFYIGVYPYHLESTGGIFDQKKNLLILTTPTTCAFFYWLGLRKEDLEKPGMKTFRALAIVIHLLLFGCVVYFEGSF